MADDKSDKGFSVVDRRVSTEEEPAAETPDKPDKEAREKEGAAEPGQGMQDNKPAAASDEKAAAPVPEDQASEEKAQEGRGPAMPVTFPTFLLSLHTSALIHLGIISDPSADQKLFSLELAQQNIDLLEILKEKTKGNLAEEEAKLLDNILYELRMAYVQVSGAAAAKETGK